MVIMVNQLEISSKGGDKSKSMMEERSKVVRAQLHLVADDDISSANYDKKKGETFTIGVKESKGMMHKAQVPSKTVNVVAYQPRRQAFYRPCCTHHPPPHHHHHHHPRQIPRAVAFHPHAYPPPIMVPLGVPYQPHPNPHNHGQQHQLLPQQRVPGYSYARQTILPAPKKLYDEISAVSDSKETVEPLKNTPSDDDKTVPTKKIQNPLTGAALLLEAARVQQERDMRNAETTKSDQMEGDSRSSSPGSIPTLVSEDQQEDQQSHPRPGSSQPFPLVVPDKTHHSFGQPSAFHSVRNMMPHGNVDRACTVRRPPVKHAKPTARRSSGRGKWTSEEDSILRSVVQKLGARKWSSIAAYLPGRDGKHCRNRWNYHLSPHVSKVQWTIFEDFAILFMHKVYGNRWSMMAQVLDGRTDNAVKNRFNATIKARVEAYLSFRQGRTIDADEHGRYAYGNDLEGCLWAMRGLPVASSQEKARGSKASSTWRGNNSFYFTRVYAHAEEWKLCEDHPKWGDRVMNMIDVKLGHRRGAVRQM